MQFVATLAVCCSFLGPYSFGDSIFSRVFLPLILCAVRIVNSAGETPKDVARRFGRLGCLALLGGDSGKTSCGKTGGNPIKMLCLL